MPFSCPHACHSPIQTRGICQHSAATKAYDDYQQSYVCQCRKESGQVLQCLLHSVSSNAAPDSTGHCESIVTLRAIRPGLVDAESLSTCPSFPGLLLLFEIMKVSQDSLHHSLASTPYLQEGYSPSWAARYNTRFLKKSTLRGVVFLFFSNRVHKSESGS